MGITPVKREEPMPTQDMIEYKKRGTILEHWRDCARDMGFVLRTLKAIIKESHSECRPLHGSTLPPFGGCIQPLKFGRK